MIVNQLQYIANANENAAHRVDFTVRRLFVLQE